MPGNRRAPRGHGRIKGPNQAFSSNNDRSLMASAGPLVTNHLQLHDLDLELALLKRKREMIEKQHTLLVNESRFGGSSQYGFNQASQSYGQQSEVTSNFSSFYNDPPAPQYNRFDTPRGVKRPAIDPWDNSAPKRFSTPTGSRRAPSRYEPRATARSQPVNQPPPLMSSSFRNRKPASTSRPTFRPTKVAKPKPTAPPNKLDSHPVAERKQLVSMASELVETPKTFVLEADKPVNPKLLGRLELALGTVLREIRQSYATVEPYAAILSSTTGQRTIKQILRERIRTMMLGKPVGTGPQIVELYRKEHPKATDVDLLNKARESTIQNSSFAIELIQQGNPEKYFKNNFRRLLDKTLSEMFSRLQKLYQNVDDNKGTLQEIIDNMFAEIEKSVEEDVRQEEEEKNQFTEKTEMAEPDDRTKVNGTKDETADVAKADSSNDIIADEDTGETNEDAAKPAENDSKMEQEKTELDEAAAKPDSSVENEKTDENNTEKTMNIDKGELIKARFYNRLMVTMLRRNLPHVLPKYKEYLKNIINTDEAFRETKAYLIKSTNDKADNIANKKKDSENTQPKKAAESAEKSTLFVRILGRPVLPRKKQMKAFLDTFHPTLIKKHRNMHNVLFVSFDSKENFDNILAKNGTTLASCRLDIRVSEKINKNNKNQKVADTNTQTDANPNDNDIEIIEPKSDSVELDDTLDDQISDLLTSIREEEEKGDEEEKMQDNDAELKSEDAEMKVEDANGTKNAEHPDNEDKVVKDVTEDVEISEQASKEDNEAEKEEPVQDSTEKKELEVVKQDVEAIKAEANSPAKGTPTRTSARTRRASKLP